MAMKKHYFVIEIECYDPQARRAARDRLHRWIEAFGHTSPSYGFEFAAVTVPVVVQSEND